jgi:hypothetical protein
MGSRSVPAYRKSHSKGFLKQLPPCHSQPSFRSHPPRNRLGRKPKAHTNDIAVVSPASAANASGFIQTTLSGVTRRISIYLSSTTYSRRVTPDRVLTLLAINRASAMPQISSKATSGPVRGSLVRCQSQCGIIGVKFRLRRHATTTPISNRRIKFRGLNFAGLTSEVFSETMSVSWRSKSPPLH